jgi:hypothetical protein
VKKSVKTTQRQHSKHAFCPPGHWFVSALNLHHSPSCDSVGQCSADLLRELPGFKGSLVQGLSTARSRVASAVKTIDRINVDHRPALVRRAISKAKKTIPPFVPALLSDPNNSAPPLYNQAGSTSATTGRDIAAREKRIRSFGESNRVAPRKSLRTQHPIPASQVQQVALASKMHEYFGLEIRAHQKQKRQKYRCGRCGKAEGHNAAKCPNRSPGNIDRDVSPGNYMST